MAPYPGVRETDSGPAGRLSSGLPRNAEEDEYCEEICPRGTELLARPTYTHHSFVI